MANEKVGTEQFEMIAKIDGMDLEAMSVINRGLILSLDGNICYADGAAASMIDRCDPIQTIAKIGDATLRVMQLGQVGFVAMLGDDIIFVPQVHPQRIQPEPLLVYRCKDSADVYVISIINAGGILTVGDGLTYIPGLRITDQGDGTATIS